MVEDQEIKQGDDTITISKVSIVKKEIGEVKPKGNNFEVSEENGAKFSVKTREEGIEQLIRNWNLQQ